MELIIMSLGGSLVALAVQFSEFAISLRSRLRNFGLKEVTVTADPRVVIPGC